MLQRFAISICSFVLLLTFVACKPIPPEPTPTPEPSTSLEIADVIAVNGDLRIHRDDWGDDASYAPAIVGTELQRGDLLEPDAATTAHVVCLTAGGDVQIRPVSSYRDRPPCAFAAERSMSIFRSAAVRAAPPQTPLRILAPSTGHIRSAYPRLRWLSTQSVDSYIVTLRTLGEVAPLWKQHVNGITELVYPNDAPALQPGQSYQLAVQHADDPTIRAESLSFSVLDAAAEQQLQEQEQQLTTLQATHGLDEFALKFAQARLYLAHDLIAEATSLFEELADEQAPPAVWRWLGKLYGHQGLADLAENANRRALDISQRIGDTEGVALAATALARHILALGGDIPEHRATARIFYTQAIEAYAALGATATAERLREEMEDTIGAE